ncbi:glycosyltransferase family 2 protein [Desertihabitans brevis]|uniref:Glycosyltransferase family 2 protein n=1 Tax=Desertihabitans brevis TaxID=2268447 RepID=A0A367YRD2_9ACTN|nr:glycosyltransferase family 2 protein [Desertihabitans brevis]RCK68109.1 glycosyltransferase family 2 protein [Desertihabitans brevis]
MPRLSVIATFYSIESIVAHTLTSLSRAATPDIEFILVDDCSPDGTYDELTRLVERVPNATLLRNEHNLGISATRNLALSRAQGDYICYLDGDDFVAPDHYTSMIAAIEELGVDFVRADHVRVHGRRRQVHRIPHGPRRVPDSPRNGILPVNLSTSIDVPQPWTGIYSRRLHDELDVLRFDESLRTAEDREQMWRLYLAADSFAVVGLTGQFWRREVTSSLTAITDDRQFDFIPSYEKVLAAVRANPDFLRFEPKVARTYLAMLSFHLTKPEYSHALKAELRRRAHQSLTVLWDDAFAEQYALQSPDRRHVLSKVGVPA